MNELSLCFIKSLGVDVDGNNVYEFLFTDKPDSFWGEGFENMPASLVLDIAPNKNSYCLVKTIKTKLKLCLAQNSTSYSMQDCIDNIIALAYEDIFGYEEFPAEGRLVLHYGESYEDVEYKLIKRNVFLKDGLNDNEIDDEE